MLLRLLDSTLLGLLDFVLPRLLDGLVKALDALEVTYRDNGIDFHIN